MAAPDHDDGFRDAVALVEAAIRDDLAGCGVILRNMSAADAAVSLAKILSELVKDNGAGRAVCPGCWRAYAEEAISRP